jgi:hypothetical protein
VRQQFCRLSQGSTHGLGIRLLRLGWSGLPPLLLQLLIGSVTIYSSSSSWVVCRAHWVRLQASGKLSVSLRALLLLQGVSWVMLGCLHPCKQPQLGGCGS